MSAQVVEALSTKCNFPLRLGNDPGLEGRGVHYMGGAAWGDHSWPDVCQHHEHERRRAHDEHRDLRGQGRSSAHHRRHPGWHGACRPRDGYAVSSLRAGPGRPDGTDKPSSERSHGTDDPPPEGNLAAAIGIEAKTGQFPFAILSMVGQDPPGGVGCHSARQVDHEVGIFGHHLLLCPTSPMIQRRRKKTATVGLSRSGARQVPIIGPGGAEQGPDQVNA